MANEGEVSGYGLDVYVSMACSVMAMVNMLINTDEVQLAVQDAFLGAQSIGKPLNDRSRPLQKNCLDAVFMIKMGVHGRQGQIMACMLQTGDALTQIALVVVVDVGQACDARPLR